MVYLRKEPTTDSVTLEHRRKYSARHVLGTHMDVQSYAEQSATTKIGRWPWFYSNKPRKGCKTVMLNCTRHNVMWLPDL